MVREGDPILLVKNNQETPVLFQVHAVLVTIPFPELSKTKFSWVVKAKAQVCLTSVKICFIIFIWLSFCLQNFPFNLRSIESVERMGPVCFYIWSNIWPIYILLWFCYWFDQHLFIIYIFFSQFDAGKLLFKKKQDFVTQKQAKFFKSTWCMDVWNDVLSYAHAMSLYHELCLLIWSAGVQSNWKR